MNRGIDESAPLRGSALVLVNVPPAEVWGLPTDIERFRLVKLSDSRFLAKSLEASLNTLKETVEASRGNP